MRPDIAPAGIFPDYELVLGTSVGHRSLARSARGDQPNPPRLGSEQTPTFGIGRVTKTVVPIPEELMLNVPPS